MSNNGRFLSRKIIALLLVFVIVFTLSSCSISESFNKFTSFLNPLNRTLDQLVREQMPALQPNIQISDALSPISYQDRYGYKSLNNEQKVIYDKINQAALNYHRFVDLRDQPVPINDFLRIYYYYMDDHPEVFWVNPHTNSYYLDNQEEMCIGVKIQYIANNSADSYDSVTDEVNKNASSEELFALREEFNTKINQILQTMSSEDDLLTRELKIYNYIAENVTYDYDLYNEIINDTTVTRPILQSAYGAAVESLTVCTGYAKLFSLLANAVGIECLAQYGKLQGNSHQWNTVCLDGKYYNVDVTTSIIAYEDQTLVDYTYFNTTDQQISKTHTITPSFLIDSDIQVSYNVPPCDATENSFDALFAYQVSGSSFNQKDYQQLIVRLHTYNLTELYFRFPEGSTQNTAQNYFNSNSKQMEKLASKYFTLGEYFYYLEPNSAFIRLEKK